MWHAWMYIALGVIGILGAGLVLVLLMSWRIRQRTPYVPPLYTGWARHDRKQR